jgi:hypothetical protein
MRNLRKAVSRKGREGIKTQRPQKDAGQGFA